MQPGYGGPARGTGMPPRGAPGAPSSVPGGAPGQPVHPSASGVPASSYMPSQQQQQQQQQAYAARSAYPTQQPARPIPASIPRPSSLPQPSTVAPQQRVGVPTSTSVPPSMAGYAHPPATGPAVPSATTSSQQRPGTYPANAPRGPVSNNRFPGSGGSVNLGVANSATMNNMNNMVNSGAKSNVNSVNPHGVGAMGGVVGAGGSAAKPIVGSVGAGTGNAAGPRMLPPSNSAAGRSPLPGVAGASGVGSGPGIGGPSGINAPKPGDTLAPRMPPLTASSFLKLRARGFGDQELLASVRKLNDLVQSIDPHAELEPAVQEVLLELAVAFVQEAAEQGIKLANHRGSNELRLDDLRMFVEGRLGLHVPGFGSTLTGGMPASQFDNQRRHGPDYVPDAHATRLEIKRKAHVLLHDNLVLDSK